MKLVGFLFVVAPLVFCASGCGGADSGAVKAGGTITIAGKPVEGLAVTFTPKTGRPASGVTDASGNFTLTTINAGDGAVAGDHVVTVTEVTGNAPPPMPGTPEAAAAPQQSTKAPPKYADPKQSGLTATVTPGGDNNFKFDLLW